MMDTRHVRVFPHQGAHPRPTDESAGGGGRGAAWAAGGTCCAERVSFWAAAAARTAASSSALVASVTRTPGKKSPAGSHQGWPQRHWGCLGGGGGGSTFPASHALASAQLSIGSPSGRAAAAHKVAHLAGRGSGHGRQRSASAAWSRTRPAPPPRPPPPLPGWRHPPPCGPAEQERVAWGQDVCTCSCPAARATLWAPEWGGGA